ncbi:hypothetical protein ALC53_06993, partial [Atta colombica]
SKRLRRAVQPLTVKKNAACNKGRGAKDEAQLIETSAKRSYVPVVYYGSRRLLPNARCKKLYARTYLRLDACVPWTPYIIQLSRSYADVLTDDETSRIGPTSHTMKIRHNLTSRRLSRDKDDQWRVSPPKMMQHVEPKPDHCAQIS